MKVPLSWLREFVEVDISAEVLAEKLTFAGIEIAEIVRIGDFWKRETVLVGEIVKVEPHPNADRLTLPTVAYGDGRIIRLVTGAPNIKVGMTGIKVPVALVGSELIDGHATDGRRIVLKPSKLRGVESAGMVCSERELGLSEAHEGILILPDDAPVGTPLVDYLGETVLELELTPNLSRCLSILGVAREVAAITGKPLTYRPAPAPQGEHAAETLMSIDIEDSRLSARYCGTYIGGVKIGASPFVIQRRLLNTGMRPISNVVDATNYLMLELGQPLHAFDYGLLKARSSNGLPKITVRPARTGEKLVSLDNVERGCTEETLLICDERGPIAVAGVMGGLDTEVRDESTEILLESANFYHASIRRTAQRLKLPSQAAYRFGKGLPASLSYEAACRATELIARLTGGSTARGVVDCYPREQPTITVVTSPAEFTRLLGYEIPRARIVSVLTALDFSIREEGDDLWVKVPPHRLDVTIAADLVEDVARIEGYQTMPSTLMREYLPPQSRNHQLEAVEEVRDVLASCGLQEVINYSLHDESQLRAWSDVTEPDYFPYRGLLRVVNPLSEDRTTLRSNLMPGLFQTLRSNRRFLDRVPVFEVGRVFRPLSGPPLKSEEPQRVALLLWGRREDPWWGASGEAETFGFFHLKGIVERLLSRLGIADGVFSLSARACLQEGRGVELTIGGLAVGWLGELSPAVCRDFDLGEGRVVAAELDLELLGKNRRTLLFTAPPRFPAVFADLALVVDDDLPAADLEREIRAAGGALLSSTWVFDIYRGPQIPEGKKSLAFSLQFQAPDRTLTEDETTTLREKIVAALRRTFGAEVRGA